MGAPHNIKRYGETWPQYRIEYSLKELELFKNIVVLSGGWAWHFLSPEGHTEYKHAHDHKDIDMFVHPRDVAEVMSIMIQNGYKKVWTRYDTLPSTENFRRYEKIITRSDHKSFRITIDFFVREVPYRKVKGWNIIEPSFLLTLYNNIHSSDKCWAVQAALTLLKKQIDPLDREELVKIPAQNNQLQ
ncbi:hypothetical protein [Aquimarina algicola]|uniref:Nucleotidyltransferase family protein n=1 Tax=Aquimarina algicola TaxID=2589995 RepID=A0A504JE66_9FLAO|nr:hypothetical protein [Aquimarina algicola]TPN86942.1 hypothetical protein FHK87_04890 [Aquimarina algicola]